jgi:flavoprotein
MKTVSNMQLVTGVTSNLIAKQDNGLAATIVAKTAAITMTVSHYKKGKQND